MFENSKEIEIVKDDIKKLRLSLEELGKIKESLKLDIVELEKRASYYKDIDEKVEEAENVLSKLNSKIADASQNKSIYDSLVLKIEESKEFQNNLNHQNKELLSKLDELSLLIKDKNNELDKLNVELNSTTLLYKKSVEEYNKETEKMSSLLVMAKIEYEDKLSKYQKSIDELNQVQNELIQANDGWVKKINELEKKFNDSETNLKEKDKEALIIIANADDYALFVKKDADEYVAKKNEELIKISGELSNKESILLKKEQSLKLAKKELEEFYNRKIDHIII